MAGLRAIGRYQLLQVIGKGGMGVVYLAKDPILQRLVAIKVLAPHLASDETVIARFINEARIAASLQHPNIVTVYEAGQDGDFVFMAMEYVEGQDLAALLRQRGRLHPDEAIAILRGVALALDYAHQRGIIHRDVKPSNVLVSEDGVVKLMDFGIARVVGGERHTKTGVLVGTPEYMAPELWEGKEADKMADLYALGVMAYEMLTGEVPFSGETPIAVGYKHVHGEVPRSGMVDEVLRVAMAKERGRRFQSGMAMVTALEKALQGREITLPQSATGVLTYYLPVEQPLKRGLPQTYQSQISSHEPKTLRGREDWVYSVAFSSDGQILASGSFDNTIKLWRVSDGSLIRTLRGHKSSVCSVVFSPDGQILASGSYDKTIKLWRVSDGSLVETLKGHKGGVNSAVFSPDGQILASGAGDYYGDYTIKLWYVSDGSLLTTLKGHIGGVWSVVFSPDGKILASGSWDKTIKLWRVSDGSLIETIEGHKDGVLSVAFSPDGQILASGSADKTIKLWRVFER